MHPLTDTWWERLITRTDGALRRGPAGWRYTPARLTIHELDAALRGQLSLGTYAVGETGLASWLCLDADSADGLAQLCDLAQGMDLSHTLVETSRRGGHLWWLCPPTPWEAVQAFGRSLVGDRQIEVFPKGPGRNGVKLPRTRHPKSGEIHPVIDASTGEIRSNDSLRALTVAPIPEIGERPKPSSRSVLVQPSGEAFAQLVGAVEQLTRLRQYGPERAIGCCPFHDDRHPSLSLVGGFWRCWAGCGEGGLNAFRAKARARGLEVRQDAIHATQ